MKKIITLIFIAFIVPVAYAESADFVVGPAKSELVVLPGESRAFELVLANRLGRDSSFAVSVSPVSPGLSGNVVALSKNDDFLYDASPFISLPETIFVENGEAAPLRFVVSVPEGTLPGSYYAAILSRDSGTGAVSASTEIGALVFVRVPGEAVQSGLLSDFSLSGRRSLSVAGDVQFDVAYRNEGNVHVNPYGIIVIKNMFGREVVAVPIEPWFVFGESERVITAHADMSSAFGIYSANLFLNRGYEDVIDESRVSFVLVPAWFIALLAVFAVFALSVFSSSRLRAPKVAAVIVLCSLGLGVSAQVMQSGAYRLDSDSVNFGGGFSQSASYNQESTMGEIATGYSGSSGYNLHAGYQQMSDVFISISPATDIVLSPDLGSTSEGLSDGATSVVVTTDSPAGYEMFVSASTAPALSSADDSFADYPPALSIPDLVFNNAPAQSRFAFSPFGSDVVQRFLNDGAVCDAGALSALDECWDGLAVAPALIAKSLLPNNPLGEATTLSFRAGIGAGKVQTPGLYEAEVVLTAIAL